MTDREKAIRREFLDRKYSNDPKVQSMNEIEFTNYWNKEYGDIYDRNTNGYVPTEEDKARVMIEEELFPLKQKSEIAQQQAAFMENNFRGSKEAVEAKAHADDLEKQYNQQKLDRLKKWQAEYAGGLRYGEMLQKQKKTNQFLVQEIRH